MEKSFPMKKIPFIFIAVLLFQSVQVFAQRLSLKDLKVEYSRNPTSVDAVPRFSWKMVSAIKNTTQTQYQIRLSKTPNFKSIIWQTEQRTENSLFNRYTGDKLSSKTTYYWQLRVKDNHGNNSSWSDVQQFQTGLEDKDWTAKWISVEGPDSSLASPMMRKTFNLTKKVKSATAYITAKGLYEASINGKKLGDHYFAPGWTSYKDHIQYQVYPIDVKTLGTKNAIGVTLADGWYKGRIGFTNQSRFYGDRRALLMQLEIEYADGSHEVIQTDQSWKSSYGPIRSSSIYDGETYDARLEKTGWNTASFVESETWKPVAIAEKGTEKLVGMQGPGVGKHEEFKALRIFKTPLGETVVDFGQNLVGWVILRAKGKSGTKIVLRHAEVLDKAGNFYTTNLRSAKQQNTYILKGENEEVFEPHFSFQGFRYVQIEGYPGTLTAENLSAVALYSDMENTGTFTSSNPLLNQLQHNIQWGQKGNFVDVPTDCPQRDERLGWTGDAQAFASTAAYNMNVSGFFAKWLADVRADQQSNGSVPFVVPNVLGVNDAGSAGWADVATILPWDMYVAYGDKGILDIQYPSMKKWVDFIHSKSRENLWNTGSHFGDWLFYRPNDDNDGRAAVTDKYMIAQTFYAHSTQLLIKAANVLGKKEDAEKYSLLLDSIKSAYVQEYMTPNGKLVSNTQTAYVLALQFDMLPEKLRAQAADRLVQNIRDYGNHLTTGFLGTPYLCHVLSRFGHADVAYDLLLQETYPSWLYPVKMGATTIWERWDGQKPDGSFQTADMNSFNHYAYGAIGDWMYKNIAGIQPLEDSPGYKQFRIAPNPGGKLTSATATLESMYGTIKSSWTLKDGQFMLDVQIPPNSSATLVLPKSGKTEKIGSGAYHFEYRY